MGFALQNENEAYADLLCGHLRGFAYRLKMLPEDKWDWTPDVAAPTARILAAHAWQWLICDRYHITIPNVDEHPAVPEPPSDPVAMIAALEEETANWQNLIAGFTQEDFARTIYQFGEPRAEGNVRGFVAHMIQNAIYKHGQFATLFYALGLDGTGPYDAPWPNPIYAEVRQAR